MEMLPKNGFIRIETKQTGKDMCISNTKTRLVKDKNPVLLHPQILLLLKVLRKFQKEGKTIILIAPSWKGQVWTDLLKKLTVSTIPLGKSENVLIKGKA
jgi:hypothetical protein